MTNHVVLVDETDREVGSMEKMQAHREGRLHRAFSIFIFNQQGEMLIQRRSPAKYHTGMLWSNACCSHPIPGETIEAALLRKLQQEMGFTCSLKSAFSFTYRAELDNGLTEHEIDHVYTGYFSGVPQPNPEEVCDWKFIEYGVLRDEVKKNPERYTPWFRMLLDPLSDHIQGVKP
jgi:isopentenyl-diphosphate delta-isomerase